MRCCHRLTCCTSCCGGSLLADLSCGCMRSYRCFHGSPCLNLSARPCSGDLYCVLRATVITILSEQVQDSFGTVRSPTGEKDMAVSVQRATAMSSNKTAISHGVLNSGLRRASSTRLQSRGECLAAEPCPLCHSCRNCSGQERPGRRLQTLARGIAWPSSPRAPWAITAAAALLAAATIAASIRLRRKQAQQMSRVFLARAPLPRW